MFRKMREAAERDRRLEWSRLMSKVASFMLQHGFTRQVDGDDLLFRSPSGATVVWLGACRSDRRFGCIVERWERGDVTITQTDGYAVRTVLRALAASGATGEWLAEYVSGHQPFVVVTEDADGRRMRVATDQPITPDTADRVFDWVRAARARELAVKRERLMWEVA